MECHRIGQRHSYSIARPSWLALYPSVKWINSYLKFAFFGILVYLNYFGHNTTGTAWYLLEFDKDMAIVFPNPTANTL